LHPSNYLSPGGKAATSTRHYRAIVAMFSHMADQHAQSGEGQAAPSPDAAAPPHGAGPRAADPRPGAPAPLGDWRAAAFWMACGALLAGVAFGAVMRVQRVGVERDMMAVAATLPAAPASTPASIRAEAAPATPAVLQPSVPPPRPDIAARDTRPSETAVARRRVLHSPPAHAAKAHAKSGLSARAGRAAAEQKYAGVFKRCPPRGTPGALQCRRDICNGAEGRGPACKPYLRKRP